jgi:hypothetical protein
MSKSDKRHWQRVLSFAVGLIGVLSVTHTVSHAVSATFHMRSSIRTTHVKSITTTIPLVTDCEGDACGEVVLTWDETEQQYKVQNNSTERWVRVDAANLAATATTCVAPEKTQYLSLKSIAGAYHAKYDVTCSNPQ